MKRGSRPPRTAPTSPPASTSPSASTLLTLTTEKVVAGGLGLARHAGGVVLVRGALGGEVVEARVQEARGVRQGVIHRLVTASPERVDAPLLPTADLAHASYKAQLIIKRQLVEEALTRIAKLEHPVAECVPSPRQWAYRGGAQYLVTPEGLAYRERRGHSAWLLGKGNPDPLIMDSVQDIMARLDTARLEGAQGVAFRGSRHSGEVVAALIGSGEPRAYLRAADALLDLGVIGVSLAAPASRRFTAGVKLIAGEASVQERLGDVLASVSASGFAQINPEAAGLAYRSAAALAGSGKLAIDLYGGSGAIGRHLAQQFEEVIVIDTASEALKRGQRDVGESGEPNVIFERSDAAQMPDADVIVVDPPRAGLSQQAREAIDANAASTLIYVSCDPATWARDVGELVRRGWALGEVTPHDFYPQTSHVEIVSRLSR